MKLESVSVKASLPAVATPMLESGGMGLSGNPGTGSAEPSRSIKFLVRSGKSVIPTRPQRPALESVIGPVDSRMRILDTELHLWRMICSLEIRGPAGMFVGTGWFAGPRTIVTAGHCIMASIMGGAAISIAVIPGRNGSDEPFGRKISTNFSATNLWIANQDPDFDIGCIHLSESFDPHPGWFATEVVDAAELQGFHVNVAGYPADKGGDKMYHDARQVLATTDRRVFYDVDTMGGQSGAPVWLHKAPGHPPVVVGIHAYGEGGTPASLGIEANSAPRIIPEVFQLIADWVAADTQ